MERILSFAYDSTRYEQVKSYEDSISTEEKSNSSRVIHFQQNIIITYLFIYFVFRIPRPRVPRVTYNMNEYTFSNLDAWRLDAATGVWRIIEPKNKEKKMLVR